MPRALSGTYPPLTAKLGHPCNRMPNRTVPAYGPLVAGRIPIRTKLSSGMSHLCGQRLGIDHDPFKILESVHRLRFAYVRLQFVDSTRALRDVGCGTNSRVT